MPDEPSLSPESALVPDPWESRPVAAGDASVSLDAPDDTLAAPDPAAVSGPPWPPLIAGPGYRPPALIHWPIRLGVAALAACVGLLVSTAMSTPPAPTPQASWLVAHDAAILKLNRDQAALRTDNPAAGGPVDRWLTDWRSFHDDAVAATELPNPGGPATAPWREMLNNYVNGSSEIVQAVATRNTPELDQAQRDLAAGDQAAHAFNQAMGIPTP